MKILYIDCFYGFSAHMLLGAILDMYDISHTLSEWGDLSCTSVLRSSIECKTAFLKDSLGEDITKKAISDAIEHLGIDYVMCSPVPLNDFADGEVISALETGGIEVYASDKGAYITLDGARFLASVISESGAKPKMDILAVGYGADADDADSFLCATAGEYGSEGFLQKQCEYGEYV